MVKRWQMTAAIGCALACFALSVSPCLGCGMDWRLPMAGPFPEGGFDEKGRLLVAEELGWLDLGSGDSAERLGIFAKFSPKYQSSSPYFGQSWLVGILEARLVQLSEREFLAEMPNGWTRVFYRAKPTDTVLREGAGWKGEIKGDTITLWADCGWKLVFRRGQLISMTTPKSHRLDYEFRNGKAVAIKEGGKDVLRVETDVNGTPNAMVLNGNQRVEFALDKKPVIQQTGSVRVVGGTTMSLNKLIVANGRKKTFEFGVNEKMQPTLKVGTANVAERIIAWDPMNSELISDGQFRYTISHPDPEGNARIERIDDTGQFEMWHKGVSFQHAVNREGQETIVQYFASGILAGHIREIKRKAKDEGFITIDKRIYDESGRLLRHQQPDGLIEYFTYEIEGSTRTSATIDRNGSIVRESTFALIDKGSLEIISDYLKRTRVERFLDNDRKLLTVKEVALSTNEQKGANDEQEAQN